jgi:flavin reductase (DIM6/NTAB) family NADH-FMN oxidoreductase RutF
MQLQTSYARAIGRKYPEQVVIAIAKDSSGKYNPITLGWTMITSGEPPMMAISIGIGRHSLEAVRQAGAFVLSFPSTAMEEDTLFFGTHSGRDRDKLAERGTASQPASQIDCVLLSDAVTNFECSVEGEITTGDHVLFVGRVVAAHVHDDANVDRLYNFGDGSFGRAGEASE